MQAAHHTRRHFPGDAVCKACSASASHICTHCDQFYCQKCAKWLLDISVDKGNSIVPFQSDRHPRKSQSEAVEDILDSEGVQAAHSCHHVTGWLEDVAGHLQEWGTEARKQILQAAGDIEGTLAAWRHGLCHELDSHMTKSARRLQQLQSQYEKNPRRVCQICTQEVNSHDESVKIKNDNKCRLQGSKEAVENSERVCLLAAEIDTSVMETVQASVRNLCSLTLRTVDEAFEEFFQNLEKDREEKLDAVAGSTESLIPQNCNDEEKSISRDTESHRRDPTSHRTNNVYINRAKNVYFAEQLIDVQIRTDTVSDSGQKEGDVMQEVEHLVVAQHSTTINIHVNDQPDLVQHVLIEQITDSKLVRAVDNILVAKATWTTTEIDASDDNLKEQRHICEAAAQTAHKCISECEMEEFSRLEEERRADLIRCHREQKKEMEVKVVSFVVKVQEAHDHLVSSVLQQMEAGKLSDVVRRLFTEFNVRLMAVDCGLGFIMNVPTAQWVETKGKQQEIQEVLSGLLPGQTRWSDPQICKISLDTEGDSSLQLGQALPIQEGKDNALTENMSYWLNFVRSQFPERYSRTYTIPSSTEGIVSTDSHLLSDSPQQRVLCSLEKMARDRQEAMVILGQLRFGQFRGDAPHAAAVAQLRPDSRLSEVAATSIDEAPSDDFELLLITRSHGLVVCQMKTLGQNFRRKNYSDEQVDTFVRKVVRLSVNQLKKVEDDLRRVVGQFVPGVVIRKTIGFPFLPSQVLVKAVSGDQTLLKDLGQCLGSNANPTDIADLCLFNDNLSERGELDPKVFQRLEEWWVRRVAGPGPNPAMTFEQYDLLLARFCGPLMSAVLPSISKPRLSLAVPEPGDAENCAHITLTVQQINLLHTAPPRLFVSGPPGTGKSVLLLLAAMEWLSGGHDIAVMITWRKSRAASYLLYHLLQLYVKRKSLAGHAVGKVSVEDVQVENEIHMKAKAERLKMRDNVFFVADEAGPDRNETFQMLCLELLTQNPDLHLWVASNEHSRAPAGWQEGTLNEPLRRPPEIVAAVSQAKEILAGKVDAYGTTAMPFWDLCTPENILFHRGDNHWNPSAHDCAKCGWNLALCLQRLGIGLNDTPASASVTGRTKGWSSSGHLRFKDVFILFHDTFASSCGLLAGLRNYQIPFEIIKEHSVTDIKDVALGGSDVVRVGHWDAVRGLERRVVVFVASGNGQTWFDRLLALSRCTEHLVCVYQP